MKKIPLSQGKCALVDDEVFEKINKYKWSACLKRKTKNELWVAVRSVKDDNIKGGRKIIVMHREIMGFPNEQVDHLNNNSLDNRKENLRLVNATQNGANKRPPFNNAVGYRGVWYDKDLKKYRANIKPENKTVHLGCFKTAKEAAIVWNSKAVEIWGEYAFQNKI